MILEYGQPKRTSENRADADRVWSDIKLEEKIVKTPNLMVYEVYITNTQTSNTQVEQTKTKDQVEPESSILQRPGLHNSGTKTHDQ